jgi:hypothetical protein
MSSRSESSFRAVLLLVSISLALTALACGSSGMEIPDGEVDVIDDELPPSGTVLFDEQSDTVLSHRQRGHIVGTYLDASGRPGPTTVTLSLLGNAYDTTLETTVVETSPDEEGAFSAALIAGSVDSVFTVRAVAADGARAEMEVRIVSESRGELIVMPEPAGRRRVDYYAVYLYEGGTCSGSLPEPDFQYESETTPVAFTSLPEETLFTVVVHGYACDADVLEGDCIRWVEGCREDVPTGTDSAPPVAIPLIDDVHYFDHEFFGTLTVLDAGDILEPRAGQMIDALRPLATSLEGIADLLLDGIQNGLDPVDADIFLGARQAGAVDALVVSLILGSGSWDPANEIAVLESFLQSSCSEIVLAGWLDRNFWPDDPEEVFPAKHILESMGAGDFNVITRVLEPDTRESQTLVSYSLDVASLGEHTFPVGGGTLLLALLDEHLAGLLEDPVDSTGVVERWLGSHVDCAALGMMLADDPILADLAGGEGAGAFYEARCLEVIGGFPRSLELAAVEHDTALPTLSLEGTADFLEEDGSPRPGKTALGEWSRVTWGEDVFPAPQPFELEPAELPDPLE